jgi:3-hydroxy-3-methylglutaryl CoA synthase
MTGICAYGVYIPLYRLALSEIAAATGGFAQDGEKAVANFDEDSITMATEAALCCLNSKNETDRATVQGLYFATTTSPFKEKQSAVTISTALDLASEIQTLDSFGSLRSGTNALRAALDTVKAGSADKIMVATADCRLGYPQSALEELFGDGAAALLIGDTDVAVEIEERFSLADEITDLWRRDEDRFVRMWEDRFNLLQGFQRVVKDAVQKAVLKFGIDLSEISKVVYYAPNARAHTALAKAIGLNYKNQVQTPLFDVLGNTGTASTFIQLAAALDEAKPGDRILMASYGNGCDVFLLKVTDLIKDVQNGMQVKDMIASKKMLPNYHKYLNLRDLLQTEHSRQPAINTPATLLWREQESLLRFYAGKCKECGNLQYPALQICAKCASKRKGGKIRLSDQQAEVFLSTIDTLGFGGESSPAWAIADMPAGLRIRLQVADCEAIEDVPPGTKLNPTFRKFKRQGDTPVYFWKLKLPR